jgi:diphosphomevalonate decarboxylase
MSQTATAIAHPNIAFIKYWGNVDHELRIPSNGSISMNLGELETRTRVKFDSKFDKDSLILNDERITGAGLIRVAKLLDRVRKMADITLFAKVTSQNNFPMGSGIASSASAFAALSLAATTAADLSFDEVRLSRFARVSSGSASRSVPGGFVEWISGSNHETSYSESIGPPNHWDLVDCVTIIDYAHKAVGSTDGHTIADTSPFQKARVIDSERRLDICRQAIINRDFEEFAEIVELDSNMMHAVMITSSPSLTYIMPASLAVVQSVKNWRIKEGLKVCTTLDAGPNVHVICNDKNSQEIFNRLKKIPGVQEVIVSHPGGPARLV